MLKAYLATHNISIYRILKSSGISMDTLFELCKNDIVVRSERYNIDGFVSRKNKKYYLCFAYKHKEYEYELCPIKREASVLIDSIALWELEKHLADIEMAEAYALCTKTKG